MIFKQTIFNSFRNQHESISGPKFRIKEQEFHEQELLNFCKGNLHLKIIIDKIEVYSDVKTIFKPTHKFTINHTYLSFDSFFTPDDQVVSNQHNKNENNQGDKYHFFIS